jgi:3-oxoacyl-[acyl-carrier protein] reductase
MTKKYLIIGSSGSIGKAISERLRLGSHDVIGTSRTHSDNQTLQLDLLNDEHILKLKDENLKPDGIIFCAGYEPQLSLTDMTHEHQQTMLGVHLIGPINLLQALKQQLKPGGAIVFISSVAAYKGSYDPMYAMVKGGVLSLTRTLAVELGKSGIRVNCIAPGLVEDSPVFNRMTPDFREKHINNTLNKKLASPHDCAEAIYFLLTQTHITGQVLHINGGQFFGN